MSNWRAIGGTRVYRPWKKFAQGDVLTGTLTDVLEDNFGNPSYTIRIDSTDFEDDNDNLTEGTLFGMNSSGSLNYKMASVEIGSFIQVEYEGTTVLEKGKFKGKECHSVNVSIDPTKGTTPSHDNVDVEEVVETEL